MSTILIGVECEKVKLLWRDIVIVAGGLGGGGFPSSIRFEIGSHKVARRERYTLPRD